MAAGLSACVASSRASAYAAAVRGTWHGTGIPPADMTAAHREVVRYATLAPNNHNTQPWKFRIVDGRLLLGPDLARRTPVVDPDNHHLFVSLGCAAENARLAAGALGMGGEVDYRPEEGGGLAIDLARGPSTPSILFDAIPQRESTRELYDGKMPPTAHLAALARCAGDLGVDILMLTERRRIESIAELVVEANGMQMADPAFMRELKRWIRFDEPEAMRTRDGLFVGCTGNPSLPRWLAAPLFDLFVTARSESARYARQIRSSGGVAVLAGEGGGPRQWAAVGRACERFLLQATALGLRSAFVNQPVEVPAVRDQLARHLGVAPRRPDLVLRFGYGPPITRSLRRPVEQVLCHADEGSLDR